MSVTCESLDGSRRLRGGWSGRMRFHLLFLYHECRDQACDIRIVNKEVSRRHLEVYVNQDGNVCIRSLGREPVLLNGEQVLSSKVLQTKDTIEVLLEGRTREFHFQGVSRVDKVRSPLAASSVINRIPEEVHHDAMVAPADDDVMEEEKKEEEGQDDAIKLPDAGEKAEEVPVAMQEDVEAPDVLKEEEHVEAPDVHKEEEHVEAPDVMEEDVEEEDDSPCDDDPVLSEDMAVISGMVSDMVQRIFERVVVAAENAAHVMTPNVGKSKRKSVRFVAGTPEGQACDATMTIRCVPKGEQSVLVEDDTVAFSKWGFATMEKDEREEEAHIETVVSKQSKKESLGVQDTPGSVKHVHAKSVTPMQRSSKLEFDGAGVENTPGCQQNGAQAPASTPVTEAKHVTVNNMGAEVDFNALATKLGEIAEEHDVQFELPAGFMRFTPMSTTKSKRKSSHGAHSLKDMSERLSMSSTDEDGDVKFDLPKDFMRFTPMSAPAKNIQGKDSEEGSVEFDLPKGFMRFTPLTEPKRRKSIKSASGGLEDMEYELPKGFMRFTPMASTKKETSSTNGMAYDLPKDFMRFTPVTVASKKSKTPSEKIEYELPEDFMRWTPAAKSAVKALKNLEKSMSEIGDIHEATEDGAEEIATLRSVGHAVHELADAMDRVASVKKSARKTPGVRIAIVEKGSTFKTDNPQVRLVFGAEADSMPEEQASPANKVIPKKTSHSAHGLRTVMVQAKAYRSQALVLGKHLRRSAKRFAKMRATARILSSKYKAEKAKRIELQNTLKELIKVREDQERDLPSEGEEEEEEGPMEEESRVIVVGHTPAVPSTNVEIAGSVVVVRPEAARPDMVTPETIKINKRPPRSVRTLCKSVRRISNGDEMQVFLDDIKMPKWIYDNEEQEDRDLEKDMDDGNNEEEMPPLEHHEDSHSEGENEDAPEDICHVCKTGNDGDILLLCDSCDNACHLHCCKPIRKRVPKGDWFCQDCKEAKKAANVAPKQTTQRGKKRNVTSDDSKPAPKKAKENAPKMAAKGKQAVSPATEQAPQTRTRRTRSTRRA